MKNKIAFIPGQFDECEKIALKNFEKFAKRLPRIFYSYTGTASGSRVDVMSENITGGCAVIELKRRHENAAKYPDVFIEPDKLAALKRIWEEKGYFPIYINFIGDYKDVYAFYIPEIERCTEHKNVTIKHQNGEYSQEDRYGLFWEDAHHFILKDDDTYEEIKPVNVKPVNIKAKRLNGKEKEHNAKNDTEA